MNTDQFIERLSNDELRAFQQIAQAALYLQATNGDPETFKLCEELLQPALQARALDGWLYYWQSYYYH